MQYHKITVTFESDYTEAAEDLITAVFCDAGLKGVECCVPLTAPDDGLGEPIRITPLEYTITGYVPESGDPDKIITGLQALAQNAYLPDLSLRVRMETVHDRDWAHAWKDHFDVIRVSDRLVIKPRWKSHIPLPQDIVIHLDPGMAFGTGTHPTTRMCLNRIEALMMPGQTFLDVGCGSGILMIAASRLGAVSVTGLDIDPDAVAVTRENLAWNNILPERYSVFSGALDTYPAGTYDLIAANIIAHTLVALLPEIRSRMAPKSHAVFSGIIREHRDRVVQALNRNGLNLVHEETCDEWVTLTLTPVS